MIGCFEVTAHDRLVTVVEHRFGDLGWREVWCLRPGSGTVRVPAFSGRLEFRVRYEPVAYYDAWVARVMEDNPFDEEDV